EGCCETLNDAGLGAPTHISWSPPAEYARVDGLDRPLLEVCTGPDRTTAVFASNDVAAIALQEFADRVGYRVPEDISIVGFDDVPMAGLARIGLTTLAQPRDELARLGIAGVADRIERKVKGPPRTTLVKVNLVTRRSTARLETDPSCARLPAGGLDASPGRLEHYGPFQNGPLQAAGYGQRGGLQHAS